MFDAEKSAAMILKEEKSRGILIALYRSCKNFLLRRISMAEVLQPRLEPGQSEESTTPTSSPQRVCVTSGTDAASSAIEKHG